MEVELRLFATLRDRLPKENRGVDKVQLPEGSTVNDLIDRLQISQAEAAVIMVNGKKTSPDTSLTDGDRLSIFPPIGGG